MVKLSLGSIFYVTLYIVFQFQNLLMLNPVVSQTVLLVTAKLISETLCWLVEHGTESVNGTVLLCRKPTDWLPALENCLKNRHFLVFKNQIPSKVHILGKMLFLWNFIAVTFNFIFNPDLWVVIGLGCSSWVIILHPFFFVRYTKCPPPPKKNL